MTNIVKNNQLAKLLFGQQHLMTQFFFVTRLGQYHTVEVQELPHVKCLASSEDMGSSGDGYLDYLSCSWDYYRGKHQNTSEERRRKLEGYRQFYADVKGRVHLGEQAIETPISVCQRPDGRVVIVDGNHRASIALVLGLDVRAEFVPLKEQLRNVVRVSNEFYGTQRLGRPYQGVYYGGQELVPGRRPDMVERINRIEPSDLEGQTVLDLGCNIGMNCYLATERGATAAVGIEASPHISSAAIRLNAYFTAPCYFIAHDLHEPINYLPQFDTVFCFSVQDHLRSRDGIMETITRTVGKVLYLEGHAGSTREDYSYLLNENMFSRIDLLGYGHDGVHTDSRTRPLFRCEVKRALAREAERCLLDTSSFARFFCIGSDAWQDSLTQLAPKSHPSASSHPSVESTVEEIEAMIPTGQRFLLVDDNHLSGVLNPDRRAVPFLEREGEYWGPPPDDKTAIEEFERLRRSGASWMVFAWPAFWWLDYYRGFHDYLRANFRCILQNERLLIFDLHI